MVVIPFVSANWFINQLKMNKNQSKGLEMELPQKMIDEGKPMPDYFKNHPVYYAGPAKTPKGMAMSGAINENLVPTKDKSTIIV